MTSAVGDAAGLAQRVTTLIDRGSRVVGPTPSANAIVLADLNLSRLELGAPGSRTGSVAHSTR